MREVECFLENNPTVAKFVNKQCYKTIGLWPFWMQFFKTRNSNRTWRMTDGFGISIRRVSIGQPGHRDVSYLKFFDPSPHNNKWIINNQWITFWYHLINYFFKADWFFFRRGSQKLFRAGCRYPSLKTEEQCRITTSVAQSCWPE